ncbi:Diaminopimelate decarboxylase [Varanus komodoensis]|nr:Diaminopimelate decarboxylase [Varanus komodoensis]
MGIREFPNGTTRGKTVAIGMRRSPDVSPRRLSDISPQLRQLKYLVVDEAIKEDLKWSRSMEDLTSASVGLTSIEERILRITGYYGYQPWAASYKSGCCVSRMRDWWIFVCDQRGSFCVLMFWKGTIAWHAFTVQSDKEKAIVESEESRPAGLIWRSDREGVCISLGITGQKARADSDTTLDKLQKETS